MPLDEVEEILGRCLQICHHVYFSLETFNSSLVEEAGQDYFLLHRQPQTT
jgi:hypothetical protein